MHYFLTPKWAKVFILLANPGDGIDIHQTQIQHWPLSSINVTSVKYSQSENGNFDPVKHDMRQLFLINSKALSQESASGSLEHYAGKDLLDFNY